MYVYVCMYVCMYVVSMCVCVCVCMYVCMYVYRYPDMNTLGRFNLTMLSYGGKNLNLYPSKL